MKQKKQKQRKKQNLKRFLPYYKKYMRVFLFDLVCASLTTVCALVLPLLIRELTNLAINDVSKLTTSFIVKVVAVYIVLRIIDAAATFYMNSYGHIMGTKMETDMRTDLFDHLQKLSFSYYDNAKVGQIMSRITTDLFDVTEFAHHCPEEIFISTTKIVASFAILSTMNLQLTLIMFSVLPLMLLSASIFNKRMKNAFRKQRAQLGDVNAQVEDSILGIRVVKSFANEELEKKKFQAGNHKFYQVKSLSYMYMGGFQALNKLFDGLMYISVILFGSIFLMQGTLSVAEFTAYLLYVTTLIESIRMLVQFTEQFQRGMTGIERFYEIMDIPVEIQDKEGAIELQDVIGEVDFHDVSFQYVDHDKRVLSKINLKVKGGENIALVGPSGGGKSTLCNLIPRFYEISDGQILIDGKDIRDLTIQSLRESIGYVQQDVYLFSGTILDNILYGKPGASRSAVEEAAKKAGAHHFIQQLPEGYDTYVGERGVKLSGGQKQRISIARAFLKNPPILILDEATSALDNESEKIVQDSLEELSKGRTTFTIAHRLTTIQNATVILVLTENGIEEKGTHQELLEKKGIYYGLYKSYEQLSGRE